MESKNNNKKKILKDCNHFLKVNLSLLIFKVQKNINTKNVLGKKCNRVR